MLPIKYCFHVPYCNCFIISNLENMQKSKGSRSKIVKNRVFLRVKPGIPIPVDVVPVPDPTRTRGYGSGRVYPRVQVDPHTSNLDPAGDRDRYGPQNLAYGVLKFPGTVLMDWRRKGSRVTWRLAVQFKMR